mmetsp:Transcript_22984/g.46536  ORF Transcript_22984/g.46536 Transcript_22984/m.46536 type:complete len:268 (+) Transcript_22984:415-1218(+)
MASDDDGLHRILRHLGLLLRGGRTAGRHAHIGLRTPVGEPDEATLLPPEAQEDGEEAGGADGRPVDAGGEVGRQAEQRLRDGGAEAAHVADREVVAQGEAQASDPGGEELRAVEVDRGAGESLRKSEDEAHGYVGIGDTVGVEAEPRVHRQSNQREERRAHSSDQADTVPVGEPASQWCDGQGDQLICVPHEERVGGAQAVVEERGERPEGRHVPHGRDGHGGAKAQDQRARMLHQQLHGRVAVHRPARGTSSAASLVAGMRIALRC